MQYEELHDEGQVSWVLGEWAAGLVECLERQSALPQDEQLDTETREELLTALFDLWKFGYNYGGIAGEFAGGKGARGTQSEPKRVVNGLPPKTSNGTDIPIITRT